jgi:hypothetical protein
LHAGDERRAAVELARHEIGTIVLHSDNVRAGGTRHAVGEDVFRKAFQRPEDAIERLFEIMEGA